MNQGHGILIFGFFFLLFLIWLWRYPGSGEEIGQATPPLKHGEARHKLDEWLRDNGLESLLSYMEESGIKTLEDCVSMDTEALSYFIESDTLSSLQTALSELDLELWLKKWNLLDLQVVLSEAGYTSRLALCDMTMEKAIQLSREKLKSTEEQNHLKEALSELTDETTGWCLEARRKEPQLDSGWTVGGVLFYVVVTILGICLILAAVVAVGYVVIVVIFIVAIPILIGMVTTVVSGITQGIIREILNAFTGRRTQVNPPRRTRPSSASTANTMSISHILYEFISKLFGGDRRQRVRRRSVPANSQSFTLGLYERVLGTYLDRHQCVMEWNHDDYLQVGGSSVVTIKLVSKNGSPYVLKAFDCFRCKIVSIRGKTAIPHVIEPTSLVGENTIRISFTAKIAGQYCATFKVNDASIFGEVFRRYLPGPVDSNKTVFLDKTAVLVVTRGVYSAMKVIPKDIFGNKADIEEEAVEIEIRKDSKDGEEIYHELVVYKNDNDCYELLIKVDREGHYVAWVKYHKQRIGPPSFTILSLSEEKMQIVEKNVKKKNLNVYYEASVAEKGKRVYCYISPRQLQVKEYFMKFIPTRTYTCKVSPSTHIIFHPDLKTFTLDDGFQEPLTLISPHREVLGATFHKFVLKNIGGSEKFQDKQNFFYGKLREHHYKQNRNEKQVSVSRYDLLESARKATKHFSNSDWCKKFVIEFKGEEGLDWGGLSREFFELICIHLFDASNKLFMRFSDENHQSLVHPNHASNRPTALKLKHFNFAGRIVGKCLYESAMGNTILVKARFTRSFLAQLIGLRINYRYFESDDPDLYTTKIQYVLDNDVTDLGLVFAEEEFHSHSGNPTIIPLMENGEEKEVTEENKTQYLNTLAQYRLAKRVNEEVEQFMKGLNEIVPDTLLSIFDENELELLMCGVGRISYEDLKQHAIVSGTSSWFQQILSWFWTIASSFTEEEMAKLLQFVTGCSQLPPGGFKELNPPFTITSSPTRGRLPTAHTCFNQLCLPEYSNCEQFQTSLMIALNEGVEGFGML